MDFISVGTQHVEGGIAYLQENAWYIVIMLGVWYYVKTNYIDPYLRERQYRAEPQRVMDYEADVRRVRLRQQELAQQRAVEAAKEREALAEIEKKRKNTAALPPNHDDGTRLGRSTDNSFNPMQPWTQSGGRGYKPARRTVRRG